MTLKIQSNFCFKRRSACTSASKWTVNVLAVLVFGLAGGNTALAGFSISVKPVQPLVTVPAVGKPRLVLSKGMSLKAVVSSFALQYGWSVAWDVPDIFVEEAQSYSGIDHEEVLVAVLRRYKLVADRYPVDKGYMIQSQQTGEKGLLK